jgi:hypothetical protein
MRGWRAFCAIACSCSAVACAKDDATLLSTSTSTSTSTPTATATATATTTTTTTTTAPYASAGIESAKSIGHTSLVLKLGLEGGLTAAYKPRSTLPLGAARYKAEIAAYRIARALGLANVPVAIPRSFAVDELRSALGRGPSGAKSDELAPDLDGRVRGALMPWIKYETFAIEAGPKRAQWEGWLLGDAPPTNDSDTSLAGQISTMLLFDYYLANWDRWSGGNVAIDRATNTVLYVDNDGALYEAPPAATLADELATIRRTKRFSRRFVGALRAFGRQALAAAVGFEESDVPLLPARILDAAEERRAKLLKVLDAKTSADGGALVFD